MDHLAALGPDDLQTIDNVLRDTPTDGITRRALIGRAAASATVLAAASPATALAAGSAPDSVGTVINFAVTAEALAVTYLTGVVSNPSQTGTSKFTPMLKAVNSAEYDHYKALMKLGAKPMTTKFWVPDTAFASGKVFGTLETLETLFVNAYLVAVNTFVAAGKPDYARYAGEIGGVEAQHLALARFAEKKLPDDRAFQQYRLHTVSAHVAALQLLGIGLGKQGDEPGKFYTFAPPPSSALAQISHNSPM